MIWLLLASRDKNSSTAKCTSEKEKRLCRLKQINVEETCNREYKFHHQMQVCSNSYYYCYYAAPLVRCCRLWSSCGSVHCWSIHYSLCWTPTSTCNDRIEPNCWAATDKPAVQPVGISLTEPVEEKMPPTEPWSSIFQYSRFFFWRSPNQNLTQTNLD